jgi:hypothetical protein
LDFFINILQLKFVLIEEVCIFYIIVIVRVLRIVVNEYFLSFAGNVVTDMSYIEKFFRPNKTSLKDHRLDSCKFFVRLIPPMRKGARHI